MGAAEKFCLRWNDFESNISHAFRELREDKDFFDVTLACDDDQLQAHKVILSACSPFFRTILRRNHHSHPLLYLKGVKYADLLAVLNFMYHGEVNVAQEELNSFLAVAEDLKVKGLTQNSSGVSDKHNVPSDPPKPRVKDRAVHYDPPPPKRARPPPPPQVPRANPTITTTTTSYQNQDDDIQEVVPVKSEPLPVPAEASTNPYNTMVEQDYSDNSQQQEGILADPNMEYGEEYADYEGYEEYDNSGMGDGQTQAANKELDDLMELHVNFDPSLDSGKPWQCTQCGKSFKKKCHVKDHIEGSHMVGLSFSCPYCAVEIGSRHRLRTHISNKHNSEHKEKQIKISQIPTNYQVKVLTQNGSDPTPMTNVPKEISRKTPNHNYPDKPPILPLPNHPRPSPPSVPRVIPTTYQADHEEIQEIVPVKSEPAAPVEDQAYSVESVDTPTENMEEYDDYSGYQEDAGYEKTGQGYTGYSQQMGQTGTTGVLESLLDHEMTEGKAALTTAKIAVEDSVTADVVILIEQHISRQLGSDKTDYVCLLCSKGCKSRGECANHIEVHYLKIVRTCPYCAIELTSRGGLRQHISRKHREEHKIAKGNFKP